MENDKKNEEKRDFRDKHGNPFMRNIWGWNFSWLGLAMMIAVGGWMAYLYYVKGPNPDWNPNTDAENTLEIQHPHLEKARQENDTLK